MGDDSPLADYVQATPLYRTHAKAITAAVSALVNVAWLAVSLPAGLVPTNVAVIVAVAVQFVGGVVGVAAVPNSPTANQMRDIEERVGRHRRA